ncbi:MAG: DNA-3-methyladenine glycosylase [Hyphomonadaceae bacterium]
MGNALKKKRKLAPAEAHLANVCPGMAAWVIRHDPFPGEFERAKDPYRALIRAVTFQQLSGKAATTIYNRLIALFPKPHPTPEALLAASDEKLRSAGLSRQKIAAIRDIAQKRLDGVIPHARALTRLPDEEIIARLTAARGVGRWTVEMYLMFSLGRPDVLPIDDLGVRKGAEKMLKRSLTPKELGEYGARWSPYRTAAAWHCWRAADTVTMEDA